MEDKRTAQKRHEKILPKNKIFTKKQKRDSNQRNQKKNGGRAVFSQVPHEKNRTSHASRSIRHRPTNQAKGGNMTEFFTKNDDRHTDDKNKTRPKQKEVHPRQQEDVTEALFRKSFKRENFQT